MTTNREEGSPEEPSSPHDTESNSSAAPLANSSHDAPPISPEAPEASTLPEAPPAAKPRKFLGMPFWVGLGVVTIGTVGLVFAAFLTLNLIQSAAEARESAETKYTTAFQEYREALKNYNNAAEDAANTIKGVKATDLGADDSVGQTRLSAAERNIAKAEKAGETPNHKRIKFEAASNEELEAETKRLHFSEKTLESGEWLFEQATETLTRAKAEREEAEAKARAAAELAAKKAAAQPVSYEDLFRAGESARGNYYVFQGKIIQDAGSGTYRVSITQKPGYSRVFWEDPILVSVTGTPPQRLLEDDLIYFVGLSMGVESYKSVLGQEITLPLVSTAGPEITITGRDG